MVATEERAAVRIFLRALRLLASRRRLARHRLVPAPGCPAGHARAALRDRVTFVDVGGCRETGGAGPRRRGGVRLRGRPRHAGHAGQRDRRRCGLVASRLPVYEEVLADGERGFMFEAGEVETLANHLTQAGRRPRAARRRRDPGGQVCRSIFSWERVTGELEQVYDELVTRRHDPVGDARLRSACRAVPDRRRPAHAHRPLLRLRHPGRGAAGRGAGAGAGRDRHHRPQRDLGARSRLAPRRTG